MTRPPAPKVNRLIHEKSPYLLQHAHNPVDWHPWSAETLALAKASQKPIFLSIGYSTCHWCHVMAHESFEDESTAALMNQHFINIKVDREERPDIDALYMTAVQALTGGGGWPMSVWLTPDLKPFYAGTYFPPDDRYGRPSFRYVLSQLADYYQKDREKVISSADEITASLQAALISSPSTNAAGLPTIEPVMKAVFKSLSATFDDSEGGFGRAPKFPMPVYLDFLLVYYSRTRDPRALHMTELTMRKMISGGLYDQLGGGFARYSTDDKWLVPHFEKMLYDNSQLISTCVSLFQATKDPLFRRVAEESISYLRRDLTHPEGAFFSAEDADSDGKEGAFYVWTLAEIKKFLPGESGDIFAARYGVTAEGNFFDPHTREAGMNVLYESESIEDIAKARDKSPADIGQILADARTQLFEIRQKRNRPHRDDKIITEWNGMMISALARASAVFGQSDYLRAAEEAAAFLKRHLFDSSSQRLHRRWREGERAIPGHQIDYAMLVRGLIDLFETSGRVEWLEWAASLHETHERLFLDANGGYFMTEERPDLLIRMKDDGDNVIPSGNSVAVLNGLKLAALTGNVTFHENALLTLRAFSEGLLSRPVSLAAMVVAMDFEFNGSLQAVIVGPYHRSDTGRLRDSVWAPLLPQKIVVPLDPDQNQTSMSSQMPWLAQMKTLHGQSSLHICDQFTCKNPTTDPEEGRRQMETSYRRV